MKWLKLYKTENAFDEKETENGVWQYDGTLQYKETAEGEDDYTNNEKLSVYVDYDRNYFEVFSKSLSPTDETLRSPGLKKQTGDKILGDAIGNSVDYSGYTPVHEGDYLYFFLYNSSDSYKFTAANKVISVGELETKTNTISGTDFTFSYYPATIMFAPVTGITFYDYEEKKDITLTYDGYATEEEINENGGFAFKWKNAEGTHTAYTRYRYPTKDTSSQIIEPNNCYFSSFEYDDVKATEFLFLTSAHITNEQEGKTNTLEQTYDKTYQIMADEMELYYAQGTIYPMVMQLTNGKKVTEDGGTDAKKYVTSIVPGFAHVTESKKSYYNKPVPKLNVTVTYYGGVPKQEEPILTASPVIQPTARVTFNKSIIGIDDFISPFGFGNVMPEDLYFTVELYSGINMRTYNGNTYDDGETFWFKVLSGSTGIEFGNALQAANTSKGSIMAEDGKIIFGQHMDGKYISFDASSQEPRS